MAITGGGGQAQLVVVAETVALPVPDRLDWDQAGGFPEAFSTATDALFTQGRLGAGERVLISGAAGGVGTAAVQLAHAAGAYVVASVRSRGPSGRRGRDSAPTTSSSPTEVAEHGPYDVSLELVGGANVAAALPLLAAGGRTVVIGVGAGAKVELNLLALMASRSTIGGSMLRSRTVEEKSAVARAVEEQAVPLLAAGAVTVPVAERFPMARAADGLRAVRRRGEVREDRPGRGVRLSAGPIRRSGPSPYRETMTDEPWPNRPWLAVIPTGRPRPAGLRPGPAAARPARTPGRWPGPGWPRRSTRAPRWD